MGEGSEGRSISSGSKASQAYTESPLRQNPGIDAAHTVTARPHAGLPGMREGPQGQNAIASISTFTPLRGGAASTVVRAGCTPWKYSLKTRLNTGKSSMFRR